MAENFEVSEIVWAKIRGYPWWPAMITGLVDENKEKKYVVGFIGDNTHSILQKQKLAKFQKEYKSYANTKKRTLLESIRLAKEMIENKGKAHDFEKMKRGGEERLSANNINSKPTQNKNRESQSSDQDSDEDEEEEQNKKKYKNIKSSSSKVVPITKDDKEQKDFSKLKRKRTEDKKENLNEVNDLMKRIINYLLFVSKSVDNYNWESNKELLLKIFEYLKDYKIPSPIEFLKKTSLGIMIKYLNSKVEDKEIQEYSNLVYKNFEEQVLDQLFKTTK